MVVVNESGLALALDRRSRTKRKEAKHLAIFSLLFSPKIERTQHIRVRELWIKKGYKWRKMKGCGHY